MWRQISDSSSQLIVSTILFFTEHITHNHGWSIILLTLVFRVVIYPLTLKSTKSMKAMQALQPKMKELQEKFKDNKEQQSRELMALYKKHGVNPLGGCLPMLLQMPIFIVLFTVLRAPEKNGFILINASFFGMDLTTAALTRIPASFLGGVALAKPNMIDLSGLGIGFFNNMFLYLPTIILVVLMVVTTFVQQKQMVVDPQQKTTMYMMNLFIVYLALMMPSGVLLYWVVSNVFQIAQQKFTGTVMATAGAGADTKTAAKSTKAKPKGLLQEKIEEVQKQVAAAKAAQPAKETPTVRTEKAVATQKKPAQTKDSYPAGTRGGAGTRKRKKKKR